MSNDRQAILEGIQAIIEQFGYVPQKALIITDSMESAINKTIILKEYGIPNVRFKIMGEDGREVQMSDILEIIESMGGEEGWPSE